MIGKATDTHYLAGLLTLCSDGGDIEVELGDKAEKERDIDIPVIRRNQNGDTEMFKGIEVKDHRTPLDVIHVEQLCAKMADMSSLTNKSMVSSSGFTGPATLKAEKHGVDLLEIVPWEDTAVGFDLEDGETELSLRLKQALVGTSCRNILVG